MKFKKIRNLRLSVIRILIKQSYSIDSIYGAYLTRADLTDANLRDADLTRANLTRAYLTRADLTGADLTVADLTRANLTEANLTGANLTGVCGNMSEIKSMQIDRYRIVWTKDILGIGCEQYLIPDWIEFSDDRITEMDTGALDWWNKWKKLIFEIIEKSTEIEK